MTIVLSPYGISGKENLIHFYPLYLANVLKEYYGTNLILPYNIFSKKIFKKERSLEEILNEIEIKETQLKNKISNLNIFPNYVSNKDLSFQTELLKEFYELNKKQIFEKDNYVFFVGDKKRVVDSLERLKIIPEYEKKKILNIVKNRKNVIRIASVNSTTPLYLNNKGITNYLAFGLFLLRDEIKNSKYLICGRDIIEKYLTPILTMNLIENTNFEEIILLNTILDNRRKKFSKYRETIGTLIIEDEDILSTLYITLLRSKKDIILSQNEINEAKHLYNKILSISNFYNYYIYKYGKKKVSSFFSCKSFSSLKEILEEKNFWKIKNWFMNYIYEIHSNRVIPLIKEKEIIPVKDISLFWSIMNLFNIKI